MTLAMFWMTLMPVDANGNYGYYPNTPPYSMGRKEFRKWARRKRISEKKGKSHD